MEADNADVRVPRRANVPEASDAAHIAVLPDDSAQTRSGQTRSQI